MVSTPRRPSVPSAQGSQCTAHTALPGVQMQSNLDCGASRSRACSATKEVRVACRCST